MQDSKPRDWADRGTATGGTPKSPVKSTGATQASPGNSNVKYGSRTTPTNGRKTYPKLPK
jgi:hypothetical protein